MAPRKFAFKILWRDFKFEVDCPLFLIFSSLTFRLQWKTIIRDREERRKVIRKVGLNPQRSARKPPIPGPRS